MIHNQDMAKFNALWLNNKFEVRRLDSCSSCDAIVNQVEVELKEADKLLEEQVETLVTMCFQNMFDHLDAMLLSRQRSLLQVADLVAVDSRGRLTVFEIKREVPNSADIIAQATKYLVECANLSPKQIARAFYSFYSDFSIFQTLRLAGLIVRRRVEGTPSLKAYLCDRLQEDERRGLEKLSESGGTGYFQEMRDKCVKHIIEPEGVDLEAAIRLSLRQAVGIENIELAESIWDHGKDFCSIFQTRFGVDSGKVELNREWQIVYVAPGFCFKSDDIKRYLTEMYLRGMQMHFYEYKVMKPKLGMGWLLMWWENRDWIDKELYTDTTKERYRKKWKWKEIEEALADFRVRMARRGYLLKKWPGNNGSWEVIDPDWRDLAVDWPMDSPPDLHRGKVTLDGLENHCLTSLKRRLREINVRIVVDRRSECVIVRWFTPPECDEKACVNAACEVAHEVLQWYAGNSK